MLFKDVAGEQRCHLTNLNGFLVAFTPRLVVLCPRLCKLVDVALSLRDIQTRNKLGKRLKYTLPDFFNVLKEVKQD